MFDQKEYNRKWRLEHREYCNQKQKEWRKDHPQGMRDIANRYYQKHKTEIQKYRKRRYNAGARKKISEQNSARLKEMKEAIRIAYGNKCACCGETTEEFLTIHHANSDGAKERRSGIRVMRLYAKIIREGFPKTYQILCMNCNHAKGIYGECPHERTRQC